MSARIQALPHHVVSQIKSTIAITSLGDAVVGLVKNSLDAGATKLDINLNFRKGTCTVEDNGLGILPAEFEEDGGLGRMHFTSKYKSGDYTYGQNGSFLAGLASVSLLTITSQHEGHRSQNSVLFHQAKVISRLLPAPPEHQLRSIDHGTKVSVRDLFGNLPVRIKQRDIKYENNLALARDWTSIRRELVSLALFANTAADISLACDDTAARLHIRRSGKGTRLVQWLSTLSQTQFITPDDHPSWRTISAATSLLKLDGGISLAPSASKDTQFIAFGKLPLTKESGKAMYEGINRIFNKSSFGAVLVDAGDKPRQEKGLRKGLEKWPRFVFQVSFLNAQQPALSSNGLLDSGILDHMLELLRLAAQEFLKKHDFKSRVTFANPDEARPDLEDQDPEAPVPAQIPTRRQRNLELDNLGNTQLQIPLFTKAASIELEGSLSRARSGTTPQSRHSAIVVNTVTGSITDVEQCYVEPSSSNKKKAAAGDNLQWLKNLTGTWQNPAYSRGEESIRQINNDISMFDAVSQTSYATKLQLFSGSRKLGLTKQDLSSAQVISQVDAKFILLKIPDRTQQQHSLILVDQHAADERCRLEQLLTELCQPNPDGIVLSDLGLRSSIKTLSLPEALAITLSDEEFELFIFYAPYLAKWGILFNAKDVSHTSYPVGSQRSVSVISLPESIAQRCISEKEMLCKALRGEVWRLHNQEGHSRPGQQQTSNGDWVRDIADCPEFVLNMLSSRACRSAIMFNDELDMEQCKSLISELALCKFPFQCAHGRPSMVPLISLNDELLHRALE